MASITQKIPVLFSQITRTSQSIPATKNTQKFVSFFTAVRFATNSHRFSSFRSSRPVQDLSEYPDVEVVKNPPEWKYVERLISPKTVPKPIPKSDYPSGWKPPQPVNDNLKYFVGRTKNFMLPVYLHTTYRGQRRVTVVRYIQGDIWSLERELHAVIEASRKGKLVASRINELSGQIHFHGDHVNLVKDWLLAKGF